MILSDALGWFELGIEIEAISKGNRLYILPIIPDDAPDKVSEGIARRRLAALEHRCPCGERWPAPTGPTGELAHVEIGHRDHCPAITKRLIREIRRWRAA